ncbi:MAG: hypothetical protein SGCHY_003268, partial [Lobulomycetales sp.]
MDHLVCFIPGTVLLSVTAGKTLESLGKLDPVAEEDVRLARGLLETCFQAYNTTATGLAPEIFMFEMQKKTPIGNEASSDSDDLWIKTADTHFLLRPEFIE